MLKEYDLCHGCGMIASSQCAFLEQKRELLSRISMLRQAEIDRQPRKKSKNERRIGEQVEWNRITADLEGCMQAVPTGGRFRIGLLTSKENKRQQAKARP